MHQTNQKFKACLALLLLSALSVIFMHSELRAAETDHGLTHVQNDYCDLVANTIPVNSQTNGLPALECLTCLPPDLIFTPDVINDFSQNFPLTGFFLGSVNKPARIILLSTLLI